VGAADLHPAYPRRVGNGLQPSFFSEVDQLQAVWRPLRVGISSVVLIWRIAPPDDVFRIATEIPLAE